MPRADRKTVVTLELSDEEAAVLARMNGGTTTDTNMLRVALWSLADHMQIEMPNGCFDLREGRGKWTRNPKIRQDVPRPEGPCDTLR